jgi:general L-amino acid transport system substrate-binding protein
MEYDLLTFENSDEALVSYDSGPCQAYTTDQAGLYAQRLKLKEPTEHMVLPEIISKEPLGPVVREGDDQWLDIVKWVHFAMINAEEMGVASGNVDEMRKSNVPGIRRLLGIDGGFGASLGLTEDWAYNLIKQVGNYGEVFNRNVGPDTPLAIARGVNALWAKGGLQYAPPIR